ncbi:MAG: 16S rRNA (guanine(527)-N(7))-methyltransferase RsmG [Actinobacteria bacterium]|nr:16S rRNA (guanine(527)-N(7))-methyltransferase RsmG [Actinomycetota bacterium]
MTFHVEQLQAYQELLATTGVEWGLIGPREVDRLWDRHIDNSLAVTEDRACLPADATVLDVGSGAGLPGIVWAIARPDLDVTLLEPLERRIRFLELAVAQLEVRNVTVVRGRAQDCHAQYDRVTARAVAAMSKLLPWLAPLVAGGGRMVLMKGERAEAEITQAQPWLTAHEWQAQVTMVGSPPRTRVVVVEPTQKG